MTRYRNIHISTTARLRTGSIAAIALLALAMTLPLRAADETQPPPPKPTTPVSLDDIVEFRNGDRLHGRLLSLAAGAPLSWHAPHYDQLLRFPLQAITTVHFATQPPASRIPLAEQTAVVMTNDDVIMGKLVAMDDKSLTLALEYGPPIIIRRAVVKTVLANIGATGSIYTGPRPGEEEQWVPSGPVKAWRLAGTKLISSAHGSITKNIPLGSNVRLQFDAELTNQSRFWVALGINPQASGLEPQMAIYISESSIMFTEIMSGPSPVRRTSNFSFQLSSKSDQSRAEFTFVLNDNLQTLTIFINGNECVSMKLSRGLENNSRGLIFGNAATKNVTIENIRLFSWGIPTEKGKDPSDLVILLNNDRLVSSATSMQNDKVSIRSPAGDLTFPFSRIRTIVLNPTRQETARRSPNDIRLWTDQLASFTLNLEKIANDGITGSSDNFGQVTVQRTGFNRIEFHLNEPREQLPTAPSPYFFRGQ